MARGGGWTARQRHGHGAAPLTFAVVLPIHFWFSATRLRSPAGGVVHYLPLAAAGACMAYGVAAPRPWQRVLLGAIPASPHWQSAGYLPEAKMR